MPDHDATAAKQDVGDSVVSQPAKVESEWRVTWFPPDTGPISVYGREFEVRGSASCAPEWAPQIERRDVFSMDDSVIASGWRKVWPSA